MTGRHEDVEMTQRIAALVRGGLRNAEIAERLGCSHSRVWDVRRRFGLAALWGGKRHDANARRAGFDDAAHAARAWAEQGATNGQIGDRLGCWPARASMYVHRLDAELGPVARPAGRGRVAW